MKHIHYLLLALVGALFTACQDGDWDAPANEKSPYGNSAIKETNVITIQDLKERYQTECSTEGKYQRISENIQIKAIVTGNDIQGNLYNEIAVQDETGAIFICITKGGMFGYLPVGAEILIDLKGLYIGNYRKQPTIGTPYEDNNGTTNVSRMPHALWVQHFTYTGNNKVVEPELFADGSAATTWDLAADAGKLGIIKNVSIKAGGYYNSDTKTYTDGVTFVPGTSTFAAEKDKGTNKAYSMSWYFNEQPDGQSGGVQIYSSSYADFAADKLPAGKMNITGVVKRYRDQWEFVIRTIEDVEDLSNNQE